jgi:hypothetical protein
MQTKLNAILEELESLKEQVAELESNLNLLEDYCIDADNGWGPIQLIREALEFSDLDDIQEYSEENVIILHKNCFRTVALANAYKAPARWNMHKLAPKDLTVELLKDNIRRANDGDYVLLKDNIFEISDEAEPIIVNTILEKKVFFIICTNNLEKIPQSIREKMRVIQ